MTFGWSVNVEGVLNEAAELDRPFDAVEAGERGQCLGQQLEYREAGGRIALLHRQFGAEPGDMADRAVLDRSLAGDEQQGAGDRPGHVVRDRRHRQRQSDRLQARLNPIEQRRRAQGASI